MSQPAAGMPRVVTIGGGFGGPFAARALGRHRNVECVMAQVTGAAPDPAGH